MASHRVTSLQETELPQTAATPAPRPGRMRSLDGLRGVAAAIVVVHHSLLLLPSFAAAYYSSPPDRHVAPMAWLATSTPLHLFWAGGEAVFVFFILSGFVLTLPALRRPLSWWRGYFPKRLARLYVPVFAAVAFGYLTLVFVPRSGGPGLSAWLALRPGVVDRNTATLDLTLVRGVSRVVSPLWSLQWEVIFSIGLPVVVLFAVLGRRLGGRWLAVVKLVGLLLVVGIGASGTHLSTLYLPMFAVGALMATELDWLRSVAQRIQVGRFPGAVWAGLLALALALCVSFWLIQGVAPTAPELEARTRVPVILGAALLVFVAAFSPGVKRVLESGKVQWLGTVSFSLYLVHEPIVVALGVLGGADHNRLAIVVAIPVSLVAAQAFYRFVERPSHRLAQFLGRVTGPRPARPQAPVDQEPRREPDAVPSRHALPVDV